MVKLGKVAKADVKKAVNKATGATLEKTVSKGKEAPPKKLGRPSKKDIAKRAADASASAKSKGNDKSKGKDKGKDKGKEKESAKGKGQQKDKVKSKPRERVVDESPVRTYSTRGGSPERVKNLVLFEVGARVEVDYKSQGNWFPGIITKDRGDGTYNIEFDDGDKEAGVEEERIVHSEMIPDPNCKRLKRIARKEKGPRLTKERLATLDGQDGVRRMDRLYRTDWSGNSESDGSVDTACLDENVCYECGEGTSDLSKEELDTIVLCDCCDGEYHLKCVGLERMPRQSVEFVCPRCREDEKQFKDLTYDIVLRDWQGRKQSVEFEIKNQKREKVGWSFSPSRPLQLAWQEFQEKQFMAVSRVFDYDTMKKLTHGDVTTFTSTGRTAMVWKGVLNEIAATLKSGIMTNLIHRDGRYDMRLPDDLVKELRLAEKLEPILELLRPIMGTPEPQIRTHNIVFVPVGSGHQRWHADDTLNQLKKQRYFTILIHLNITDELGGGTEVWSKALKRGDLVRGRPGDAFVFNGTLLHRGQGNSGKRHRLFYYASFACKPDANAEYAD